MQRNATGVSFGVGHLSPSSVSFSLTWCSKLGREAAQATGVCIGNLGMLYDSGLVVHGQAVKASFIKASLTGLRALLIASSFLFKSWLKKNALRKICHFYQAKASNSGLLSIFWMRGNRFGHPSPELSSSSSVKLSFNASSPSPSNLSFLYERRKVQHLMFETVSFTECERPCCKMC